MLQVLLQGGDFLQCDPLIAHQLFAERGKSYGGLREVQEISLTSPTAPGITHRWSSLDALTDEVANARVWAGFHYRSSGRVGTAMGGEVGRYVAANFAQAQNGDAQPPRQDAELFPPRQSVNPRIDR